MKKEVKGRRASMKRILAMVVTFMMVITAVPANSFATHASNGYPLDLNDNVVLSVYTGDEFPGETATHVDTSKYKSFDSEFEIQRNAVYAATANNVLVNKILEDVTEGTPLKYGNRTFYVWGIYDTSSDGKLAKYFKDGENNPIIAEENEQKMIEQMIGMGENPAEYEIVWYVMKYQTSDTAWHLDGMLKKKDTVSINYYGNGNTSGGAPNGATMDRGSSYTIEDKGELRKVTAGVEYTFTGWNTAADGSGTTYQPGNVITLNESMSLYAKWQGETKYKATVNLFLDGQKVDLDALHEGVTLHISKDGENYIPLNETATGTYTADVTSNGTYSLYHLKGGTYTKAGDYSISIYNNNGSLDMHHYSVNYDSNGGALDAGDDTYKTIHGEGDNAGIISETPKRSGYIFTGWNTKADGSGTAYQPKGAVRNISAKTTLYAQWEKAINVKINVVIDHQGGGGYDQMDTKDNLDVDFLQKKSGETAFIETENRLTFAKEGVSDNKDGTKEYEVVEEKGTGELSHAVLKTTYTATAQTYTGLLSSSEFSVAVQKSDYDVKNIETTEDENGDRTITVKLEFNPNNFNLEFSMKMAEDVPKELYPDAVIMKVEFWSTSRDRWEIITQQENNNPGVRVDIDEKTGEGTGSYPVWKYESGRETPYGYRTSVWRFVYDDNEVGPQPTKAVNDNVVTFEDGTYTATMGTVTDGEVFGDGLKGAYIGTDGNQVGTLDGVISVNLYDVTFDANDANATIKDAKTYELPAQYKIPDLEDYVPVHKDENYVFEGWYCDKAFNEKAVGGTRLSSDVTLYAKWKAPLTIKGAVDITSSYEQDGKTVEVNPVDRADAATVRLERIGAAGIVDSMEVEFIYDENGKASADYSFVVPDDGKEYEVIVELNNYKSTYRNDENNSYKEITENGATVNDAVFTEDDTLNTADVDIKLGFAPASYTQKVQVDSTEISENFRPGAATAAIYYRNLGSTGAYDVISQHDTEQGSSRSGIAISLDDGTGEGEESIWKYHYSGVTYEYSAGIVELTKKTDGKYAYPANDENPPYTVERSDNTTWSISEGKIIGGHEGTGVLKLTLKPNKYQVNFDVNADDVVEIEPVEHTWSFPTEITAEPTRPNYVFMGWECDTEGAYEDGKINAEVSEDVTLKAIWEEDRVGQDSDGDGKPDDPDGVPDKYQKLVTFKVVNGKWNDGKTTDINIYVTLKTNDEWDENGSASLTAPGAGEQPNENYKAGAWDVTPPTTVTGIDPVTYTYTYVAKDEYTITVNYVNEEETSIAAAYTETALEGASYDVTDNIPASIEHENNNYIKENVSGNVSGTANENITITAVYTLDNVGRDNDNDGNPDEPDGVPDKYQKPVTFKVVNGKWNDGKTTDINIYVTLKTNDEWDENGSAPLTAPTGMTANEGFKDGAWDVTPPEAVTGTEAVTYTYTYVAKDEYTITVNYVNEEGTSIAAAYTETALEGASYDVTDNIPASIKHENNNYIKENVSGNVSGTANENITITAVYTLDNVGRDNDNDGNPDEPDGIPDKYQKKVTFKVVNGTWSDGKTADIKTYVTLVDGDGNWSKDGSASLTAPTGMKPDTHYGNGKWDEEPLSEVSGTEAVTYTYEYVKVSVPITPFEPSGVKYIVEHYKADDDGAYPAEPTDKEIKSGKIGDKVTATAKTYDDYCINPQAAGTVEEGTLVEIEKDADIVILKLYYDKDVVGEDDDGDGEPDDPDGVPDKYQKPVTFKVVNGKWNDGKTTDINIYVTLKTNDEWDENGSAPLTAPTGMTANEGFKDGAWDVTPPETVRGTEAVTYTHSFKRSTTPIEPIGEVKYIVEHYKADDDGAYPAEPTDKEIKSGKIGDKVTATAKTYEGYCINPQAAGTVEEGTLVKIEKDADIVILKLYYDKDVVGEDDDGDGEPDEPDGVPDKYQKPVTFKVVNGTWSDGKTADIKTYVTLVDEDGNWSEDGSASLTAPTGMTANEGFKDGAWDVTPPEAVTGTDSVTYTYTFEEIVVPDEPEEPSEPTEPEDSDEDADIDDSTDTGDNFNMLPWMLMALMSMVAGSGALRIGRKRRN